MPYTIFYWMFHTRSDSLTTVHLVLLSTYPSYTVKETVVDDPFSTEGDPGDRDVKRADTLRKMVVLDTVGGSEGVVV